jgi:hypothetical protein
MAGAGYKLFATGDVLTAAQVNTYLMQQTVMVFASSAARTTALSGVLAEGMVSYLQDTNTLEVYDGSAWVGATGDITGLTAGTGISISSATGPVPTVTNSMATEITAKGDLIVGTGSGTFDNLAAGSNGDTIVADSSTSTGLRYNANFAAGKNAIINGAFNVWQRGTSFAISANAAYGPDRFLCDSGSLNYTFSRQAFTAGTAPAAGYESQYFLRAAATSGSGGFPKIYQKIEDVRTFAGQTVTLSVWAKSSTAGNNGALQMVQYFGTGGSPSSTWFSSSNTLALTTSWQRFSVTFNLPSFSGSTVGTNQDSWLGVYLNLPSSGTVSVDTWGWQLEASPVATAFQTATGTIQGELAACQRYLPSIQAFDGELFTGLCYSTTKAIITVPFPVTARVSPTGITVNAANRFDLRSAAAARIVCTSLAFLPGTPQGGAIDATVASGLVAGNATNLFNSNQGTILFTGCEL